MSWRRRWIPRTILLAVPLILAWILAARRSWTPVVLWGSNNEDVGRLVFSPDGRSLAWSTYTINSSTLFSCDLESRETSRLADAFSGINANSYCFSRDSRFLYASDVAWNEQRKSSMDRVTVWDHRAGKSISHRWANQNLGGHELLEDGNRVAIGFPTSIEIRQLSGMRLLQRFNGRSEVRNWTLSRDGQLAAAICCKLASGTKNIELTTISAWDTATGKRLVNLPGASAPRRLDSVKSLVIAPDNRLLLAGTDDGFIVWDLPSGKLRWTKDKLGPINVVEMSSATGTLVSAGDFTGVNLWDVASRRLLRTISMSNPVKQAAFSPDGSHLATVDGLNDVMLWRVR